MSSPASPPPLSSRCPLPSIAFLLFLLAVARPDAAQCFVGGAGESAPQGRVGIDTRRLGAGRAFIGPPAASRNLLGPGRRRRRRLAVASDGGDGDDEKGGEDWRDFRARLVQQYQQEKNVEDAQGEGEAVPAEAKGGSSSSWAYDSGDVIERGSVILSRPEQDFGYGLRQQYFHKCVILVLDHDATFTRGVILNRPTDLVLSDEDFVYDDGDPLDDPDPDSRWRLWFGGDVRGLFGDEPEVTCLHSLKSQGAADVSDEVMRDIRWTTLAGARGLVTAGEARPEDFWVFVGYAGWDGGQLEEELERESWYMAATDPATLLEELKNLERTADPRDAGMGTWEALMGMIGRGDEVAREDVGEQDGEEEEEEEGDDEKVRRFDDLMLYEWARERLVFSPGGETSDGGGGGAGSGGGEDDGSYDIFDQDDESDAAIDEMIRRATESVRSGSRIGPGTFVRSSLAGARSPPFLLDEQEFHKSVVLVLQDDESITVGVILNLPSSHAADLDLGDVGGKEGGSEAVAVPQRYGGRYGVKGASDKPFVWLHNSDALREAKVGSPIAGDPANIWICSQEDASAAVSAGVGSPRDFLVVNGFSIWEKTPVGVAALVGEQVTSADEGDDDEGAVLETAGGMRGEVWNGRFEVVPQEVVPRLWELLSRQKVLKEETLAVNIEQSNAAWEAAEPPSLGEAGADDVAAAEETANLVYNSRTSVGDLADTALRSWIATFLLGDPDLRGA